MRTESIQGPTMRPADARSLACPCGWDTRGEDQALHAYRHLEWARGVRIREAVGWPEAPIVAVWTDSPARWRHLAYQLAHLAQRAGGYDFCSFPQPHGRGRADEIRTRALLYRAGEVVVGYLAVAEVPTFNRWDFTTREILPGRDQQARPTVMLAWTAFHWRRRGIAAALVRAAADHAGVPVEGLAWAWPFTEEGRALARSFAGPDGGVWVAA